MGRRAKNLTAEEQYQRDVIAPREAQRAAEVAQQVKDSQPRWRDRATPAEKERIGYDASHPHHPQNPGHPRWWRRR